MEVNSCIRKHFTSLSHFTALTQIPEHITTIIKTLNLCRYLQFLHSKNLAITTYQLTRFRRCPVYL